MELSLKTSIGVFRFHPLEEMWIARKGGVELILADQLGLQLLESLALLEGAVARLDDALLAKVAGEVVRRHGKAYGLTKVKLKVRSISLSGRSATVFCARTKDLRGHAVAFELSPKGKVSNVGIEG